MFQMYQKASDPRIAGGVVKTAQEALDELDLDVPVASLTELSGETPDLFAPSTTVLLGKTAAEPSQRGPKPPKRNASTMHGLHVLGPPDQVQLPSQLLKLLAHVLRRHESIVVVGRILHADQTQRRLP